MNTIRNIKIATGIKRIESSDRNLAMLQLRDILKQHREVLIRSLISDLSTYINYKFSLPATKQQLEVIKDKLVDLKNSNISLSDYSELVEDVFANETTTYVKSEPFYEEINSVIIGELNPSQLMLVK